MSEKYRIKCISKQEFPEKLVKFVSSLFPRVVRAALSKFMKELCVLEILKNKQAIGDPSSPSILCVVKVWLPIVNRKKRGEGDMEKVEKQW